MLFYIFHVPVWPINSQCPILPAPDQGHGQSITSHTGPQGRGLQTTWSMRSTMSPLNTSSAGIMYMGYMYILIISCLRIHTHNVILHILCSCLTHKQSVSHITSTRSGVGVTKAISSVPLISRFFTIVKTLVTYWISCSYLTGVAAAQLRWHLSNMNVIQII